MTHPLKIIGALGLICIIAGLLLNKRKSRDFLYLIGGTFLAAYSIYIKDLIFTILQSAFVLATIYDLIRIQLRKIND